MSIQTNSPSDPKVLANIRQILISRKGVTKKYQKDPSYKNIRVENRYKNITDFLEGNGLELHSIEDPDDPNNDIHTLTVKHCYDENNNQAEVTIDLKPTEYDDLIAQLIKYGHNSERNQPRNSQEKDTKTDIAAGTAGAALGAATATASAAGLATSLGTSAAVPAAVAAAKTAKKKKQLSSEVGAIQRIQQFVASKVQQKKGKEYRTKLHRDIKDKLVDKGEQKNLKGDHNKKLHKLISKIEKQIMKMRKALINAKNRFMLNRMVKQANKLLQEAGIPKEKLTKKLNHKDVYRGQYQQETLQKDWSQSVSEQQGQEKGPKMER